ncbi:hypothetical protein KXR53_10025 [Inquilinus limosus]|uniref:hypothetical protein n=1 Tax=Inquilinus limosus TaxID=171674 RepID=UPI003F155C9A
MLTKIPVPILAGLALLATIGTALAQGDGCIQRDTTAGAQSTPATTPPPAPASDARQS